MKLLRNPVTWGVVAITLVTVLAMVTALLYISPPGRRTITFYTDDAASVQPGSEVRIAGINVGEVKNLTLEPDHVKVIARVYSSAYIGDESQIQVRMLTVVGGYYINLVSLGDQPLGDQPIPPDRVIMPYSLIRTLTDATKITDNVDPKPINESLNAIEAGLAGTNTESLNAVIEAGNALMSTIDRQRGQVTAILSLSDEYIQSLAGYRETLMVIVRKLAILQQTLDLYSRGFAISMKGIGDVLSALLPVGEFYDRHRDEFLEKVRNFLHKGRLWINRNGITVRTLRRIQNRLERVLDTQNAPPELLATNLCIPIPGSPC